jgi:uncharacterized protein DUF4157
MFRWPWSRKRPVAAGPAESAPSTVPAETSGSTVAGTDGRHRPAWRFLPPLHPILAETAPLTLTTEPVGVLEPPRAPGQVLVAATGQARLSGRVNGIVAAAPVARDLVDLPLRHAVARRGEHYVEQYPVEDAFETVEVVPPARDHGAPLPEVVTPEDLVAPPAPSVIHARPVAPSLTVAQVQSPQVAQTPSTPSRFMHITYREQDRQLAEWYAEENQTEQPAPNSRPAEEPVEADAFEPVVQELEFTPPHAGPRRSAPRPPVGPRASLAESRRQGLRIKRKPAPVTADPPDEAADVPAGQAAPDTDSRETTVEETAPPPPSPPRALEPVVAENAVAVREDEPVLPPPGDRDDIADPATPGERLIAPATTAGPLAAPLDAAVETAGLADETERPDLPLGEAGSRRTQQETAAHEDEVTHRGAAPREATRPEPVRPELPLHDKSSPAAAHDETAGPGPVRPELPLRDARAIRSARPAAAAPGDAVPEVVRREIVPSAGEERAPVRPALPLRDTGSPRIDRPEAVAPTVSRDETVRPDMPLHDTGSRRTARHEAPQQEGVVPEVGHYGNVVPSPEPAHAQSEAESGEAASGEAGRHDAAPYGTERDESRSQESSPRAAARLGMATYEPAPHATGPQGTRPQETVTQKTTTGEPVRRVAAAPESGSDGPAGGSPQPLVLRGRTHPQPSSPQPGSTQAGSPQPSPPQPSRPEATASQPTPPEPTASRPVASVRATRAASGPAHQPGGELGLTTTPQLAPVAVSILGQMVASAFEERVPHTLIAPLRRALDMDLADVPVRRGEAVSATAERLGARAFTADGAVYLPDDADAVDSTDNAALLAHELTHAAQQQRFGVTLPGLETVTGQHLETEAVAVEEWVKDGAVDPPPVVYGHVEPTRFVEQDIAEPAQAAPRLPVVSSSRPRTSTELALERFRQAVPGAPAPSGELQNPSPAGLLDRMRKQGFNAPSPSDELQNPSPAGLLDRMRKQRFNAPSPSSELQGPPPAGLLDRLRRPGLTAPPTSDELQGPPPAGLLDRLRSQSTIASPPGAALPLASSAVLLERMRKQGLDVPPPSTTISNASVAGLFGAMAEVASAAPPPVPTPVSPPVDPPDEPPEQFVTYGPDRPPPDWSPGGDSDSPAPSSQPPQPDMAEFVKEVRDNPPRRWMDLDDPDHFDEISHRVYNTLQARFRFDVLLERERSGTLMDFG